MTRYEIHTKPQYGMHTGANKVIGLTAIKLKTKRRVTVWGYVRSQHELKVFADLLLNNR